MLSGNLSPQQFFDSNVTAQEFLNDYSAMTNIQFVTALYNNILKRAPDQDALTTYVNALNSSSLTRASLVSVFVFSQEKHNDIIASVLSGATSAQSVHYDGQGDVVGATLTTTSADGRTKITQSNLQGESAATFAASGLTFDRTTIDSTFNGADGSDFVGESVYSGNGTLLSKTAELISANGLITTTYDDFTGGGGAADGVWDRKTVDTTNVNNNNSVSETSSIGLSRMLRL